MRYTVKNFVFHLWVMVSCVAMCHTEEFQDREEETLVHCVHDSAPRFGKRVCDCGYRNEAFIAPKFEGSITEIELANCKSLRIRRNTFSDLFQLTKLYIVNVEDLILEPNAFDFTGNSHAIAHLKVELINNIIEELSPYLFKGPVTEISITRCRIGIFRSYSFTSVREQLYALRIVDSVVNRIERHAFKRFDVNQVFLSGSTFLAPIPSQSFYEIEVLDWLTMTNCSFYSLLPSAFSFKNVTKLIIRNNEFNEAAGESFVMQVRNDVEITGNHFIQIDDTLFSRVNLDSSYYSRHSERPKLKFHNNRIGSINGSKTLRFSEEFAINLKSIYIDQNIDCTLLATLKESSALLVNNQDEIYFVSSHKGSNFKSFQDIQRFQCVENKIWFYLIIGSVVGSIVLAIVTLLVLWFCLAQKKKKARQFNVVMPEPRTYRETQIVMQIENHGLLKTDL